METITNVSPQKRRYMPLSFKMEQSIVNVFLGVKTRGRHHVSHIR